MATVQDVYDKTSQLRAMVAQAQADRCAYDADQATYQASMVQIMDHDIGPIFDVANQIDALAAGLVPPVPTPPPTANFAAPIPAGAIFGRAKWYPGNGCDMFCRRNTVVVAPADCLIEEVVGGTGLNGGAEIIMAMAGNAWAWRYRHVQANVKVGQKVAQGQRVGLVLDPSLDMLCVPPVITFPDGWQHLDISVNHSSDRFDPTGGSGGNYSAYQWLCDLGYTGNVLAQTPGPTSCGMTESEAVRFLMPFGRR